MKSSMTTPFVDSRTGQLYFRRAVPEALRAAFGGRGQVKITLGTKDPAVAKTSFARENAKFEEQLAEARRQMDEGTLVPTPAAAGNEMPEFEQIIANVSGARRLVAT